MLAFESDYNQGAHPEVLRRLCETNMEKLESYGRDIYSDRAAGKIRQACDVPDADVFFLVGGTQTNSTVVDAMLRQTEGVISAVSGHVNGHEAGTIEHNGHKVLPLPHKRGKLDAAVVRQYLEDFYGDANHEHMVYPGMVYISFPTEYGTLYSKAELTALSEVCREYHLPLYLDGARLGYGLESRGNELTLSDIARLCDAFYIGGTKVGALCGEAVVFPHGAPAYFYTIIKQHGAMLAKGRLCGVQFDALFTDGLYQKISRHAIDMAQKLDCALREKGYRLFLPTESNQIFVVLENEQMKRLSEKVRFGFWEKADEHHTVMRIATSWATEEAEIDELISLL